MFARVHEVRAKVLTTRIAKCTEQVYSVVDKVLELTEDLIVDHDVTSLDWFVHVEAGEDLAVFEEEVVSLSRDLRVRNVAGEDVLQPLNPGGEVLDVYVQPVGLETVGNLVTESIEVFDGLPLNQVRDGDADIDIGQVREYHGGRPGNTDNNVGTRVQRGLPLQVNSYDRLDRQGNLDWTNTWVDG